MRKMMKKLKGGAPRQRFFSQSWALVLEPSELEAAEPQERNSETEEVVRSLQEENNEMKKKIFSLNSKLKEVSSREPRKQHKSVDELGVRQKRRLKRARSSSCKASLGWLDEEGYTPISVQVLNKSTKQVEQIELENVEELLGDSSEVHTNDLDLLDMMLFVKDSYSVSDVAYHEMAQLCKQLPRQYKIKERIKDLNRLWNIKPLPNDIEGVQQSLQERLKVRIERLVQISPPDSEFVKSKKVNVKLSGDGTCIGKRLHVVCFTFTVLEESEITGSYEGNHVLAVFKTPEKYTFLKMALEDIIKDVERLKQIEVGQDNFSVDYYMGGDWKFLASITGIDSASSTYSCIWCKCGRGERYDPDKEWSVTDSSKGARSVEEIVEYAALPRSKQI